MNFKLIGSGIAGLALLATSFAAEAADIPRPIYKSAPRSVIAYYNWTGFYAGINAGYGWGTSDWDLGGIAGVEAKPDGFMIGGTLGYNYQVGSFVWGLEGDIGWSDVKGSVTCLGILTCETRNKWFATARGRLGYAFDRFMPYITGGAAFGDVEANVSPLGLSASSTRTGWTAGAGLEYAFLGNWTAKIEYLYVDLGSFDTGFTAPIISNNVDLQMNVVRAGLNYKFSGPIFSRW